MRRYDGLRAVASPVRPPAVATLGVFDGLHRGHRDVLEQVIGRAAEIGGASWLLTFAVHPDGVVHGRAPAAIESLDRRLERLAATGLDATWVLDFDDRLRAMSPEEFVTEVFVRRLGVRAVLLGEDARFGRAGRGTVETLASLGREHGFEVEPVPPVLHRGEPISSTRIRRAVREGELALAAELLGRPFSVEGRVGSGDGRGRSIGVPTANLEGRFPLLPPEGVYVASVRLREDAARSSRPVACDDGGDVGGDVGGDRVAAGEGDPIGDGRDVARVASSDPAIPAVTNIGRRPTFEGGSDGPETLSIETHLLDFEGELLGRRLEVELHAKIREERRFADSEALVRRIREDVATARAFVRPGGASGAGN